MLHYCVLVGVLLSTAHGEEDKCKVGEQTYNVGEKWQLEGKCEEATCTGSDSFGVLGCASVRVDSSAGWTLTKEDPQKPYPDCCPQPVSPPNVLSSFKDRFRKMNDRAQEINYSFRKMMQKLEKQNPIVA